MGYSSITSIQAPLESFRLWSLLDATDVRTCRPGSGHVGTGIWIGGKELTGCLEDADEIQRAFFSNYFVAHGLKYLTLLLPNGLIGSVFGSSLAQNDSGCLNKSGLCSYLE